MPRPLTVIEHERVCVVRGNAKMILQDGGFRGIWTGTVKGWILDRKRLPDLLAYLEARRVPYTFTSTRGRGVA